MSAVTEQFKVSDITEAHFKLVMRNFQRTTPARVMPSQWMNGGHNWATVEAMPSGKFLVKIGVSTL